ncbi:MAG TPA: hypothetical protein ENK85_08795 [Saprospiraceae bacterium]|nr:hypothetical protein [Saprospiraceae bacterium]
MNHTPFFKGLLMTSIIAFVISYGLAQLPQEVPFQKIILGSFVFFVGFTIIEYIVALRVVNHPNKGLYVGMVQLLTGLKIILTVALVVIFVEVKKPATNWFILPFLLNYVIFTVFETATLMRIGNKKSQKTSKK